MTSIWSKSVDFNSYPTLTDDLTVDTVVVGGGIAGILIAYSLKEQGVDAVLIDASTVCSGQTKNTTAKITSQHADIYHKINLYYGSEATKHYAFANQKAITDFQHLINQKGIDCNFEIKKSVLYSTSVDNCLKKEFKCAKMAGIDCYLTKNVDLPFFVAEALVFNNQAQFNPLKFVKPLLDDLTIYENTPAIKIVDNTVITPRAKISAKNIVLACHYPFVNFPELYFLKISQERSYVVAHKCKDFALDGMYIGVEDDSISLRNYKDYVLVGGGAHRTGVNNISNPFDMLTQKAKNYMPGSQQVAKWSAQDCITLDEIPYIGRFSKSSPNIYVATGFGKWGMTSAMVSANIITDMICGRPNNYCDIFSPNRLNLVAGAKNFATNTAETVKGFVRHLRVATATADDVPKGKAMEIKWNGETAGAYRDDNGKIYVVSLKCPHLKCKLVFNDTTKTWDCPCHGSRYDYRGNLLDNPAQSHSILLN